MPEYEPPQDFGFRIVFFKKPGGLFDMAGFDGENIYRSKFANNVSTGEGRRQNSKLQINF